MKKKLHAYLLFSAVLLFCGYYSKAVTTVYNGVTYTSTQPYNLDIYYFKPADVPLDSAYRKRISGMMFWLQSYYKQWMINNGYGAKTFGLWTSQTQPDSVRVILINAAHNLDFYRSTSATGGHDSLINEAAAFRAAHPGYITSEHLMVITATPSVAGMHDLPYYGIGRNCYVTDYPQLDMQYLGQSGTQVGTDFVTYFGGIAHELGHCLNLPHSHQTATENADPAKGESLMAAGNYTLTASPTFINRAGTAILTNCQLFSAVTSSNFYNGHAAGITALHSTVSGSNLIISGRFQSNRTVTDINFYQDPGASPTPGYDRVAFSTPPLGAQHDSFWVSMPASEVLQGTSTYPPTGPYNLEVELVLANGETSQEIFPFQYTNGIPASPTTFDYNQCDPTPAGWQLTDIGTTPSYPGKACWNAATASLALTSWGTGLDDLTDAATFFYIPVTGNDTIEGRISVAPNDVNNLAGLMIRGDLSANSNYASISALDSRGVFSQWRSTVGGYKTYNLVTAQSLPMWLRMARNGTTVDAWYSTDGINWILYDSYNQAFGSTAYFGLVASGPGARGVFDKVRISNHDPLSIGTTPANEALTFNATPNPATDVLNVRYDASATSAGALMLNDISGRCMVQQTISCNRGSNTFHVDTHTLPAGIYLLRLQQDGAAATQVMKVMITR